MPLALCKMAGILKARISDKDTASLQEKDTQWDENSPGEEGDHYDMILPRESMTKRLALSAYDR
jgi:hypothetical protein